MKYSKNFERDYNFYLQNINKFKFCGTQTPKYKAISDLNGKTAKEAFFLIDSTGKNIPTCQPKLLDMLLLCKASINFHIKIWAESRADGTLPFCEFAGDGEILEWETESITGDEGFAFLEIYAEPKPIYKKSMAIEYGFPEWVISAVEKQKEKIQKRFLA